MSYPPFMRSFRDPFYGDMWQDFEEPQFEWGLARPWVFVRPRLRRQVRRRSGNFVGMTNPWGFPQLHVEVRATKVGRRKSHPQFALECDPDKTTDIYCEPRQVPRSQYEWSCKTNEKMKQNEQSSTYPASASEHCAPDQTTNIYCEPRQVPRSQYEWSRKTNEKMKQDEYPESASEHCAPDQTTEISCEHRLAQNKRSRKMNEKVKQDEQSSTYPEYSDDSVRSETKPVVNAKPSGAEEKYERNEKAEGRRSEHQRSCGDVDPIYIADKTEFEAEEKTSRTENCRESSEDMEQLKEHDKQRRDDKHKNPMKQEHEPDNDASNKKDCDPFSSKLSAINTELSKAKELFVRVQSFSGIKTDKEYLCLDELLLRCILSLDLVETEGCDQVKAARRAAVKYIQSVISELEAKPV